MLYFSTSLRPAKDSRNLARLMADIFGGMYENRGNKSFDALINRAKYFGFSIMAIVNEVKGKPNAIVFYKLKEGMPKWEHLGKFVVTKTEPIELDKKVPKEIKGRCRLAKELKKMAKTIEDKKKSDNVVSLSSKGIYVNKKLIVEGSWTFY